MSLQLFFLYLNSMILNFIFGFQAPLFMMSPFLLFSKFMLSSINEGIKLSSVKMFLALLISHSNRSNLMIAPGKLPDLIFLY